MGEKTNSIEQNIKQINAEIKGALKKCSRSAGSCRLIAVSKFKSAEEVLAAYNSGQLEFGENYVQHIMEKFGPASPLKKEVLARIKVHMIGHLQTNKVRAVLPYVASIDSVDSLHLLSCINEEAQKIGKCQEVLMEYNTAHDGEKTGFATRSDLFEALEASQEMPGVSVCGFMTMAPNGAQEGVVSESFTTLAELFAEAKMRFPSLPLTELSMGMSADWKIALACGSTQIRVGTAIFGER